MAIKSPTSEDTNVNSLTSFAPATTAYGYSEQVTDLVDRLKASKIVEYVYGYGARLDGWLKYAQQRSQEVIKAIYPEGDGTVENLNKKLKEISDDWDNLTGQGMIVEFLIGASKESKKDYQEADKRINKLLSAAFRASLTNGTLARIYMDRFRAIFANEFEDKKTDKAALYVMGLINYIKLIQEAQQQNKTAAQIKTDIGNLSFNWQIMFRSMHRLSESKKFKISFKDQEIQVTPEMFTSDQKRILNQEMGNSIRKFFNSQGKTISGRRVDTLASARDDGLDLEMTEGTAHIVQSIEAKGKNLFFNWSSTIDYHTHTTFKEALGLKKDDAAPSYSELLEQNPLNYKVRVEKMVTKICSVVGNPALMRKIIEEEVLPKDPLVFFVGRETTKMTGVLGEIAGMYMIRSLNPTIPLTFSANLTDDMGKQFHADILLNDLFGIQAKNTKELYQTTIGFREASASTVLADPLFGDMGQVIGELEAIRYFNIPYNIDEGGKYFGVDDVTQIYRTKANKDAADKYTDAYYVLSTIVPIIDKFLRMSAAAMMYLQVGENLGNNATDLFIMGTRTAVTTAQVIQTLIDDFTKDPDFKSSHHFRIKTSLANDKTPKTYDYGNTIVDYFNQGQSYRTKRAKKMNPKVKSLSQYLERITLTSSFDFSDLIPQPQKQ